MDVEFQDTVYQFPEGTDLETAKKFLKEKVLKLPPDNYGIPAPSLVKPGTLDPFNRPVLHNPDGSRSTALTTGTEIDGLEYVIPTVIDGKQYTPKEAVDLFIKNGKKDHFGAFKDWKEADKFAQALHEKQAVALPAKAAIMDPGYYKRDDGTYFEITADHKVVEHGS